MTSTRIHASLLAFATLAALGLSTRPAQAQERVTATGVIYEVDGNRGYNYAVKIGDPFTYTFTVDPDEAQTQSSLTPGSFNRTKYDTTSSKYGNYLSFDNFTFYGNSSNHIVKQYGLDSSNGDVISQESDHDTGYGFPAGWTPYISSVYARGPGGSLNLNINDPAADWEKLKGGQLVNTITEDALFPYSQGTVYGTITSVSVQNLSTPAPEPSSLVAFSLIGLGTALQILIARRRKAHAA